MSTRRTNPGTALSFLVAALLVLPTAALAQQEHRHGRDQEARGQEQGTMMGMRQHGQMMGMMAMMAGPHPMMILRHREALGLTDEQVGKLEALQERLAGTRTAHMEGMQALHRKLAEQATAPEMDLEAYESTLREAADQRVEMHMAMARAGREAREVLTPEQREKLRVGLGFMRGTMEMMQGMERMGAAGGMAPMMEGMPCPMMGGASPNP